MAAALQTATSAAPDEPLVRQITREVPNLRHPVIADEYRKQRAVIDAVLDLRREETDFWQSAQTDEGWT